MKKYLVALLLAVVLVFAIASLASANGGPHGGYTATTDACAGCHRAHTATGPNLVMAASTYALCTSCHGSGGFGANTNVDDGRYLSTRDDVVNGGVNGNVGAAFTPDNSNLLAGGFVNYKGLASTSAHSPNGTLNLAWGQNLTDRGTATALAANLDCASCHDPHGSANYRIIKTTVNGVVGVAVAQVDENPVGCVGVACVKDYDTEQWGANQSQICKACHNAYHKIAISQGSLLNGTSYTHRVDMAWNVVPAGVTVGFNNPETTGFDGLANNGDEVPLASGTTVVCQTCHLPHGTSATMTTLADNGPSADSALLRLNNRGVCQSCHQKP